MPTACGTCSGVVAFAHQRLDGGPDEAHADIGDTGGDDFGSDRVQQQAGSQPDGHQAKAEFQRVEIAETPGEFAGLPGGKV